MSEAPPAATPLGHMAPVLNLRLINRKYGLRLLRALFLVCSLVVIGGAVATQFSSAWLAVGLQKLSDGWHRLSLTAPLPASAKSASDGSTTLHVDSGRAPVAATVGETGDTLAYGDRLKITFVESAGVSIGDPEGGPGRPVAVVFPRMDLSGEYSVDANGGVAIPKLGRIAAAGSSTEAFRSGLAQAFARYFGRPSDVSIAIIDRLPIYVVGAVRAAGKVAYQSGMIVLQAVASTGGLGSGAADTSAAIEEIRQAGQLRLATDRLDSLLIERAKLTAERDDGAVPIWPATIASRLSQSGPNDRLSRLVAAAQASLAAERSHFHDSQILAVRQIEAIKMQLAAQQHRNNQLQDLLAKKQEKLRTLQAVAQRGSIPDYMIMQAETAIAELIARQEDLRVTFAQTQSSLLEAESAKTKLGNDHFSRIEAALSAAQQNIDDGIQQVESAKAVLQVLQKTAHPDQLSRGGPQVTIERRVAGLWQAIPATERTALLPGDVVRVGALTGNSDQTASEDTKNPKDLEN